MADDRRDEARCPECGVTRPLDAMRMIDGEPVCVGCLYGDVAPITLRPIGVVINDKRRRPRGFGTTGKAVSEIRLFPGMARFMRGLADETHLTIVWHLHEAGSLKTVFARGWDGKRVGPFASRTPDRITPIAVTDVELIEVKGTTLVVRGLDAVNGTPVLDIKVAKASLERR